MGYGDPETPQEEIKGIVTSSNHLADTVKSLSNSIHFFACGIQQKDYEAFKNDVSVWLYEMCRSITHHQNTIKDNMKRIATLVDEFEKNMTDAASKNT